MAITTEIAAEGKKCQHCNNAAGKDNLMVFETKVVPENGGTVRTHRLCAVCTAIQGRTFQALQAEMEKRMRQFTQGLVDGMIKPTS